MAKVIKGEYFIFDSELYSWRDSSNRLREGARTLTVDNHTLHYGDGVFEGIRAYRSDKGTRYVLDLDGHLDRMFHGVEALHLGYGNQVCQDAGGSIQVRVTREQMRSQILDVINLNFGNGEDSIYLRPIVFRGQGLSVDPAGRRPHYAIIVQRWEDYVSGDAMLLAGRLRQANGVDYGSSEFTGFDPYTKICGNYASGVINKGQAVSVRDSNGQKIGVSEPAYLNLLYQMAEASGAVIFLFKDGQLFTPSLWDGVLDSVTRRIVLSMRPDAIVKPVSLGEFLEADEVFLAGTAAEVAVVRRLYAPQTRAKELLERGVMPAGHFEAGSRRILSAHYHYASGKRENVELMPFDLDKKSKGEVGRLAGDYQDIARARRMGDFGHLLAEVPGRPSEWAMGQMRQVRQRIGAPQSQAVPAGGALVQRKQ